jgi:hypothetical protein
METLAGTTMRQIWTVILRWITIWISAQTVVKTTVISVATTNEGAPEANLRGAIRDVFLITAVTAAMVTGSSRAL